VRKWRMDLESTIVCVSSLNRKTKGR
jgi:hypothetical protein